ncbi:glycine/sarcosine/betaine reductase complex component C subunit beta [Treponema denticola]|uniref:glycine/sarcosine/betaine reductase complex component C subunit beta n=1 Tax=Treponema denticola TaxID=158 RepID=UPI0020A350CE|nr:glycine/sarcosine/betaine reductase complex component C subunit beta [Treponema denticola]UTC93896.1 glycine reductase [Treponema denticola]
MAKVAIKGASYILVHAPDLLFHNGSTQTGTRLANPEDEYLKAIPSHLRSFEEAVNYPPNQVYIGNMAPEDLEKIPEPWYKDAKKAERKGKFGEIMTQAEFYILMKHADVFELVYFSKEFTAQAAKLIENHPMMKAQDIKLGEGHDIAEIKKMVDAHTAEGLYEQGKLIGCVKQAHDTDENLSAHTMLENLATKASGILSAWHMGNLEGIDMKDVEYIIECSEEAAGDINQRGGGNIAKAVGEKSGCVNATGSDVRGFCAAPVHAIIHGAALVAAGIFKNVMVVSGGSVPKLGMNGKDHVKKDLPLFEDMIGGFAVMLSADDGVNPVINTEVVGKHVISSGSAPQAVMSVLVYDPLNAAGLKMTDIEKYSAELQNHEITAPAGAGNVPEANVKMIAALSVMKGQLEKTQIAEFVKKHGVVGFAPTQGHIPSGVPFIGHARRDMMEGKLKNTMIIGKGSLFLGRLTNLFDGLSFLIEANDGKGSASAGQDTAGIKKIVAEAMRNVAENILKSQN